MFAGFMRPWRPLTHAASAQSGPKGGAGAPQKLLFAMQPQLQDHWCWAAASVSVSKYYDVSSQWTQCSLATECLREQCCASPRPCDIPFTLDEPLRQTGNLQVMFSGSDTFDNVCTEIESGRPVCCHLSWNHFVVISGYDPGNRDVFIEDSLYGPSTRPFQEFVDSYHDGSWDHTYYTQPQP